MYSTMHLLASIVAYDQIPLLLLWPSALPQSITDRGLPAGEPAGLAGAAAAM
jgi:hypothetical protein